MAEYHVTLEVPRPVAEMFAFLRRPANLVALAPPDLHLQLIEGPNVLVQGSRVTWKARRWGVSQTIVSEVIALQENAWIEEVQRQGPFPRWQQRLTFEPTNDGTRIQFTIDFEPPGGVLGLLVTESFLRNDLDALFAYRAEKLREMFPPH